MIAALFPYKVWLQHTLTNLFWPISTSEAVRTITPTPYYPLVMPLSNRPRKQLQYLHIHVSHSHYTNIAHVHIICIPISVRYVGVYGLPEPCDNIEVVLGQLAHRLGAQKKGDWYDLSSGCVACPAPSLPYKVVSWICSEQHGTSYQVTERGGLAAWPLTAVTTDILNCPSVPCQLMATYLATSCSSASACMCIWISVGMMVITSASNLHMWFVIVPLNESWFTFNISHQAAVINTITRTRTQKLKVK